MMIAMTRCNKPLLAALYLGLAACASNPAPTTSIAATSKQPPASKVADRNIGDPQARFASALQLLHDGRNDEAEIALQVLTQDCPQFSGPATNLGILYAKQKKTAAAIAAFKSAIKANPKNAVALNWLGQLMRAQGDSRQAEQYYQQAIAAQPTYAPAYFNLAILYDHTQRAEPALAEYRAYQKIAGADERPMVGVWIHELEARTAASGATTVAGAQK